MSSIVLLCRHGNTFNAGDRIYTVGANEDLPLTLEGEAQAVALGSSVGAVGAFPVRVRCGPLMRTKRYAQLFVEQCCAQTSVVVDQRLTELNYGLWSGKTSAEIRELSGAEELRAWDEQGVWPTTIHFTPPADQVVRELSAVLLECQEAPGLSVLVTSNGRLRTFGRLVSDGANAHGGFKMNTGASSLLRFVGGPWEILGWNLSPEEVGRILRSV